jgi:tetratricopeptide (TPR) repeat protein
VGADPLDFVAQNRLAGEYVRLLRETGDLSWLARAGRSARASLASVPGPGNAGGLTVMAIVEFESHHFAEAVELSRRAYLSDRRNTQALMTEGDAQLEMGNDAEAEAIYRDLAARDRTLPVLARLSKLEELRGRDGEAMRLLSVDDNARPRSGLPAHEISWCQVRLGELSFRNGDFERAGERYQAALELWPESYAALEHLAELRGAQGRVDASIALYEQVIERTGRPEFEQALGDLYAFAGKPEEARPWHERALAAYLRSVQEGNAHYLHHLSGYFTDSREDPAEALRWALKDMEVRHSIYAYDALAWAYYRNSRFDEALSAMKRALATGTNDAHLLYHAGLVYSSAGRWEEGRAFLRQSVAVNPKSNAFHMHR